jgi:tubulin-specific chaperone B
MLGNDEWLQAAANLKAYVTAGDVSSYQNIHENTVVLDLTHSNLKQQHIEIRFDKHQTVDDLRHKIYQKTGTPHDFQHLQVFSGANMVVEIKPTDPSTTKLGYFSLQHGMRVHCVDLNPNSISRGGALEDVSLVTKYEMSNEEYNKRKNTLRSWGQEKKAEDPTFSLAKYGKDHQKLMEAKRMHKLGLPLPDGFKLDAEGNVVKDVANDDENGPDSVAGIEVDMRCEVQPGGRRGTVKYVGEVPELANAGGYWVGIVFDEPVGKSDGTVQGQQYFEAMPKFGGFCRGKNVNVGDYPERDLFDELSDSDDEL